MKKQLISLVAIVIALSLGFTSCKNDDEVEPTPVKVVTTFDFKSSVAVSTDVAKFCDIVFEYTDLNGAKATTNLQDCPIKDFILQYGDTCKMYVFLKEESKSIDADGLPLQTTLKTTFTANGNVPTEEIAAIFVKDYDIKFKNSSNEGEYPHYKEYTFKHINFQTQEQVDRFINSVSPSLSSTSLKIEKEGNDGKILIVE